MTQTLVDRQRRGYETDGRFGHPDRELLLGGKAAGLRRLEESGYSVPPFYVVTAEAFRLTVRHNGLSSLVDAPDDLFAADRQTAALRRAEELRMRLRDVLLPSELRRAIELVHQSLLCSSTWLAVRSSVVGEDSPFHSFAGMHETVAAAFGEWAPNLRLLRKDVVRVPVDFPLYLAGVDDPGVDWAARGLELDALNDVAASCPDDGPTVLLVHRPEAFHQASKLGFQLVLSGHTHGGQLALPIPGGNFNLARLVTPFHRGLYRVNGSTLYVNRGFGFAGPAIRFNCSREIATIELVPAGSPTASPPPEA